MVFRALLKNRGLVRNQLIILQKLYLYRYYGGLFMNNELLGASLQFIKDIFANDFSGHDYYHSVRVLNLATNICNAEKGDLEIVQMAAILHDVDDYKLFDSTGLCTNAIKFMQSNGFSDDLVKSICNIISSISYKGTDTIIPDTLEGRIVQDADRLDAIGAIGIARTFAYGGSKNRNIYDPEDKPNETINFEEYKNSNGSSINHFYEKLLKLKELMNTETGKKLAENRHEYMKGYLQEFHAEWDGIN
jgi:uncharacterized protein